MKSSMPKGRWLKQNSHRLRSLFRVFIFVFCSLPLSGHAQTLFTYGRHAVSKNEFLQAYNKNNTDTGVAKVSYADYLELYLRFKLKVQAALDTHMDTTAAQLA